MNRRQFIKTGIAGSCVVPAALHAASPAGTSRVVCARRADAVNGDRLVSHEAVIKLVDRAVENLLEMPAPKAFRHLFSPTDVVGLKVNCLSGRHMSTHQEIVRALIERLRQTGLPAHHVIIWDRKDRDLQRAGYEICTDGKSVQCYGNDRAGFTRQLFEFGSVGSQLSRTLYETCTAVINLPVLKDHGITGVTGALKNFYGSINNPNKYHMNAGNPFIADVNMLQPIRQKTRLHLCDALIAQYEGGPPFMPQWSWPMQSLLASFDPVAMDQKIWDIVETKRREQGIESLTTAGRRPNYIATAADAEHRIGVNQPENIEWLEVE